jgi:hypothetical protein
LIKLLLILSLINFVSCSGDFNLTSIQAEITPNHPQYKLKIVLRAVYSNDKNEVTQLTVFRDSLVTDHFESKSFLFSFDNVYAGYVYDYMIADIKTEWNVQGGLASYNLRGSGYGVTIFFDEHYSNYTYQEWEVPYQNEYQLILSTQ